MLKGGDDLLREAGELRFELRRSSPKGEAEHQVLLPRIAGLDALQVIDDLGRRTTDPGALLQQVLEVDASGNVRRAAPVGPISRLCSALSRSMPRGAANFTCSSNIGCRG
jgi:hypothetical protein